MLERVRQHLVQLHMVAKGDRVIVSVSGGPDSVALLHSLAQLAPALGLSLHVFHLDHALRGEESSADARYVAQLAERLGIPATVIALQPGELHRLPGSLQANARRRRYEEIRHLAGQIGATKVATGHTQDDQAETVLMRILRGAGTKGLAGIPPIRTQGKLTFIRPLLLVSRQEVELYCAEHKLFPRLDASNTKTDYLRNRIRLRLIPLLAREYNPAIQANLSQLAEIMREEDQFLELLGQEAYRRCLVNESTEGVGGRPIVVLHGPRLVAEPLALARRVVRHAARTVLGPETDLGLESVTQVLNAATRHQGSHMVDLPGGLRLTVEYELCRLQAAGPMVGPGPSDQWPVLLQGETEVPALGIQIQTQSLGPEFLLPAPDPLTAVFDLDCLPGPLALRYRKPGDRIWPVGMEGSKKLQDILVDAKVPKSRRDRIPLLTAGNEVIWIPSIRLDRRFLATPSTRRPLLVRIMQRPPA